MPVDPAAADLPARLVAATIRLLGEEGPDAVRAREVTTAVGTSTMAVYQHFGGMPGLLRAAADEGFRRLDRRFAETPRSGDAVTDAYRLALVHRTVALENPHLYDLMFGLSNPGRRRDGAFDETPRPGFEAAYGQLVALAVDLAASGRIRADAPDVIAAQLWSFAHGYITLELAGHMARFPDPVEEVLLPLGAHVMTGLGDERDRALASIAAARS